MFSVSTIWIFTIKRQSDQVCDSIIACFKKNNQQEGKQVSFDISIAICTRFMYPLRATFV